MWIVHYALKTPLHVCRAFLNGVFVGRPSDYSGSQRHFPETDIPVVAVLWNYTGLTPNEMEERIVTLSERSITTTVNDVEHIESQSFSGYGLIKVFLQPHTSIDAATAQITAISQAILKAMPLGTTPPLIVQYSATMVPILQFSIGSSTKPEQTLYDLASNTLRIPICYDSGRYPAVAFRWQTSANGSQS